MIIMPDPLDVENSRRLMVAVSVGDSGYQIENHMKTGSNSEILEYLQQDGTTNVLMNRLIELDKKAEDKKGKGNLFVPYDFYLKLKEKHNERTVRMKMNLTELVFILDRSGSMSGLEEDTIGGFNSMLEKQKKEDGKALVSTVLFDSRCEVIHDRVDIQKISPMTDKEYYVQGMTALLDAVGGAIAHISHIHKTLGENNVPDHTLFVITTDGMENSSREYNTDTVKRMIEEQKEKFGWEFLFLGANIDAVKTAGNIGISADRAVNYHSDSKGTELNYDGISAAITSMRHNFGINANWKQKIEKDYENRKNK